MAVTLIMIIGGGVLTGFGLAMLGNDNIWGLGVILSVVGGFGIMGGFVYGSDWREHQHQQAHKQLTAQGWKIDSNDIHIKDETVDVASCVTMPVKEFNGKYYVVRKRTAVGGGYEIVPPTVQPKLVSACKATQEVTGK